MLTRDERGILDEYLHDVSRSRSSSTTRRFVFGVDHVVYTPADHDFWLSHTVLERRLRQQSWRRRRSIDSSISSISIIRRKKASRLIIIHTNIGKLIRVGQIKG